MILNKLNCFAIAALLAGAVAACGQGPASSPPPASQAKEITRATSETFGDYIVHFSAQSTTMLPADVARAFDIRRSGNRAMLNVTVLHKGDADGVRPVEADVKVRATNLLAQLKDVRMRELREEDAIYYIGELTVSNEEIITFNISVRPEATGTPYELSFRQQFYTN